MESSSDDEGWVMAALHGTASAPKPADALPELEEPHESSGDEDWLAAAISHGSHGHQESAVAGPAVASPTPTDIVLLNRSGPPSTRLAGQATTVVRRSAPAPKASGKQSSKYRKLAAAMLGQPSAPPTLATSTSLA